MPGLEGWRRTRLIVTWPEEIVATLECDVRSSPFALDDENTTKVDMEFRRCTEMGVRYPIRNGPGLSMGIMRSMKPISLRLEPIQGGEGGKAVSDAAGSANPGVGC